MSSHSGGRRSPKTLTLLLVWLAAFFLISVVGNAQKAGQKLTEQTIIDLLTGDVSSADVAKEAQKSGISFQVTASAERDIRGAGGTDDLIRVLKSLEPHGSTPPVTTPPVTPPHPEPPASPPVLEIRSNPGQAQVYVDDEPVGSTSQQGRLKLTRLAAGDHRVRVSLGGYQDFEQTVTLTAGGTATVPASLQRTPEVHTPTTPPTTQTEETPPVTPPATPGQNGYLGVLPMEQQPAGARGVVLSGAAPGGPAQQAGIKTYDTILAVNGQQVTTPQALRQALASHQAGESVRITWYNGSTTVTRPITLGTSPGAAGQGPIQPPPSPVPTIYPHTGVVSFYVGHDHGPNGQGGNNYCVGTMAVGNGMIYFQGIKGTNGVHNYEIPLNTVKEARRNNVYLVNIGAFHIRTKKNTNFNFVAVNQQGQYQPPDAVLTAIDNAMGK